MEIHFAVLLALATQLHALAQDAPPPRATVRNEVNIRVTETFRDRSTHENYEEPRITYLSTPAAALSWHSRCVWIQEEPQPPFAPFAPFAPPPQEPFRIIDMARTGLAGRIMTFDFCHHDGTSPGSTGDPLEFPPFTRSSYGTPDFLSPGEGGSGPDTSDTFPLYGPELDFQLARSLTGWLPDPLRVSLYGRALFGDAEICGFASDIELYSAGLRLSARVYEDRDLTVDAYASTGPGRLRTDFGDASGIDAALGARLETPLAGDLRFEAGLEANGYFSDDLTGRGLGVTLGIRLDW